MTPQEEVPVAVDQPLRGASAAASPNKARAAFDFTAQTAEDLTLRVHFWCEVKYKQLL